MISIIIPVYNDKDHISKCLNSIFNCNYKGQFEVIVVDDGSSDGLEEILDSFPCRFISKRRNSGAGKARNFGAEFAKGEVLAFVDSDCVVPPNWLSIIDNTFMENKIQAIAGKFSRNLNPEFIARYRYYEASFYTLNGREFVNTFSASSFACRRELFLKVGGFGDRPAGEEITLGYKLYKEGINILCIPEFVVAHHCLGTLRGYLKQQFIWMKNFFIVCQLHPEMVYFRGILGKRNLIFQIIVQLLLILSTVVLVNSRIKPFIFILLMNIACLSLLNFSFLRYINQKERNYFLILNSVFFIFMRNCIWIAAILCGIRINRLLLFLLFIFSKEKHFLTLR